MFSQKCRITVYIYIYIYIYSIRSHALCLLQSLWENLILLRPVRFFFKKLLSFVWVDNKYAYTSDFSQNNFFRLLSHKARKWNNKTLRFVSFLKERFRPLITGEV
jgi:hypothetical protein